MTCKWKGKRMVNICKYFQELLLSCAVCASRKGGNCILNKRMLEFPLSSGLNPKFPADQGARGNPKFNKIFQEVGCKIQFGH